MGKDECAANGRACSAFFKVSTEKIRFPLTTPAEHLPKYKEFLLSDKEFKENTKAPRYCLKNLCRYSYSQQCSEAIDDLTKSINDFFEFFKNDPSKTTLHPAFGELNFDEWVQLHHKHVTHHLKQFGLIEYSQLAPHSYNTSHDC